MAGDEQGIEASRLEDEIQRLRERLGQAEDELRAIRDGEVDALLVQAGKEAVYTLERPEQSFRMLVEQIPEGAATLRLDGTIICCNDRFASLVRRRANDLEGLSIRDLVASESQAALDAMLAKAPTSDVEETLILRTGIVAAAPVPLSLHAIGESAFGLCLMLTDLTEQRRLEEQERTQQALRRSEEALRDADRRKDEFLATLAHELRNPLAPVRNAVEFLRAKGTAASELRWAHDVIDRQVLTMARLLDDLLDVSRIALDKPELRRGLVELAEVIDAAVETSLPLVGQAHQELTVTLPPDPIHLEADPVRLAQVFGNLLNNAAKYTDVGGKISLAAEQDGNEVRVTVSDTGIGIAPELLPHIFEIFSQAKSPTGRSQGGLGIGLSLVKGLVELHGGSVTAHSDGPGRGSTFTVRLPVARRVPADAAQAGESNAAGPSRHRRVLVVDDHRDSAESLAMLLTAMGHEVEKAYDGQQAIDMASTLRPDLLLLDIGMPQMDGYEACRRIKSEPWGEKMCVVALTGWGQEEDRRKSQAAGFDHHLVKPVEMGQLAQLIERLDTPGGSADGGLTDTSREPFRLDGRPRTGWKSSDAAPKA
jgi:signal transduction histidine kinase/ActR/RegA family two-component response regulator